MAQEKNKAPKEAGAKPQRTKERRKNYRQNKRHMNIPDFLFDSAYQVVTWVFITSSIGGIFYFLAKGIHRGSLWSFVALVCSIVVMIGLIADRYFCRGSTKEVQKERPYVFIHENALTKPLTGGERITIRVGFENTGPGEITLTMRNSTACFVVDDRRALKYAPYDPAATVTIAIPPKHRAEITLNFPGEFTTEDIKGLHDGRAKLYFFARGEYKDESGRKYPLDFRRKYDPEMPGGLVVCEDSITISD